MAISDVSKNAIHSQFYNDFQEFIIPKMEDFMNNKQKSNKIEIKKKIYWKEEQIFIKKLEKEGELSSTSRAIFNEYLKIKK